MFVNDLLAFFKNCSSTCKISTVAFEMIMFCYLLQQIQIQVTVLTLLSISRPTITDMLFSAVQLLITLQCLGGSRSNVTTTVLLFEDPLQVVRYVFCESVFNTVLKPPVAAVMFASSLQERIQSIVSCFVSLFSCAVGGPTFPGGSHGS